jgi:hypothetical protein
MTEIEAVTEVKIILIGKEFDKNTRRRSQVNFNWVKGVIAEDNKVDSSFPHKLEQQSCGTKLNIH